MTIYITPHLLDSSAHPIESARGPGPVGRMIGGAVRNWRRRKMIAALDAMDDRLLNDIGIRRADIGRVVRSLDCRELRMAPVAPPNRRDRAEAEVWDLAA